MDAIKQLSLMLLTTASISTVLAQCPVTPCFTEGTAENSLRTSPLVFQPVPCPAGSTQITQALIGTKGFVISKPGNYCLAEDIHFNPKTDTTSAIKIRASNVNLDLNGHTIVQENDKINNSGIIICPNLTNITVTNGTIAEFGALGIRVLPGSSNLVFDSLAFVDCGIRGQTRCDEDDAPCVAGGIALEGGDEEKALVLPRTRNVLINRISSTTSLLLSKMRRSFGAPLPVKYAAISVKSADNVSIVNCITDLGFPLEVTEAPCQPATREVFGISVVTSSCTHICVHSASIGGDGTCPVTVTGFDNVIDSSYSDATILFPDTDSSVDFIWGVDPVSSESETEKSNGLGILLSGTRGFFSTTTTKTAFLSQENKVGLVTSSKLSNILVSRSSLSNKSFIIHRSSLVGSAFIAA